MEWISVKDRLPYHGETVVVLMEARATHDYVRRSHYKDGVFYEQNGRVIENVEYWRNNLC